MDQTQSRISDEWLEEPNGEDWRKAHAAFAHNRNPMIPRFTAVELQAYVFKGHREFTALRASHKRLVDVLEEIERHHLELNRAKGRPANHSHTLRLCAAALADARKLEGK